MPRPTSRAATGTVLCRRGSLRVFGSPRWGGSAQRPPIATRGPRFAPSAMRGARAGERARSRRATCPGRTPSPCSTPSPIHRAPAAAPAPRAVGSRTRARRRRRPPQRRAPAVRRRGRTPTGVSTAGSLAVLGSARWFAEHVEAVSVVEAVWNELEFRSAHFDPVGLCARARRSGKKKRAQGLARPV